MKPDTTVIQMVKRFDSWHAQIKSAIPFTWTTIAIDTDANRLEQAVSGWYPKVMFSYPSTPRPQKGA